jgi:sugar O-acyltransferase (sialic acid O-acetyltransferase NeuD family)
VLGILDDTPGLQGTELCGVPVLGTIDDWPRFSAALFVVALGSPRSRKAVVSRMETQGAVSYASLVHPGALFSQHVQFGAGSMIMAGCILTTQVSVGRHCVVNLGCTVGHDARFGDFCTLGPQAAVSGNVTLGAGVYLGTGAVVVERITVGHGSVVAAGAVVSKDVPDSVMVAGSPARHVRTLEPFDASPPDRRVLEKE